MAKTKLSPVSTGDVPYVLIGISSAEERYRLLSLVSDFLPGELRLREKVPFSSRGKPVYFFSVYTAENPEGGVEYYFVSNSSDFEAEPDAGSQETLFGREKIESRVRLVKELPSVDFFLIVRAEAAHQLAPGLLDSLRASIPEGRFEMISLHSLSSEGNLIFW
jgi:hypothetical protein